MRVLKKILGVTSILLLGATVLNAAEPSAQTIANKAYSYLESLDNYAFTATVVDKNMGKGEESGKKEWRQKLTTDVSRPGKFKIVSKGSMGNKRMYLNDGLFTMIDTKHKTYGQIETPKSVDKALDFIYEAYGVRVPLASLIYNDMATRPTFKKSKYFGTKTIHGEVCDYVAFKDKVRTVHLWITQGDKPLLRAFTIYDTSFGKNVRRDVSLAWNTEPKFSKKAFVFHAPSGAMVVPVKARK